MALEPNTAQGEVAGADDGNVVDTTVAQSIGLTVARHTSGLRVGRSFGDAIFGLEARRQALLSSPLTSVESIGRISVLPSDELACRVGK
jgi:hypothetical protein